MGNFEFNLGLHCAPTLVGIKAASMFSIDNNSIYDLDYFALKLKQKGLKFEIISYINNRVLVYVYQDSLLNDILFDQSNRSFLSNYGYEYETMEDALKILKGRMQRNEFPHEIGIFLDYPLDDVLGFINQNSECLYCGYWKVYKNPYEKN